MEKANIYANGQIYAIRSHQTEFIYIGSTTQTLHKRFHDHKNLRNKCFSKEIIQYSDAYIELIEDFPCNSKKELNRREGQHIRNTENCINKCIPGRTRKEYYTDNKDKLLDRAKEYYITNKNKILEFRREYCAVNKDKIKEYNKQYYNANIKI